MGTAGFPTTPNYGYYGSYAINNANYEESDPNTPEDTRSLRTPPAGGRLSSIARPAQTIWVGDSNGHFELPWKDGVQDLIILRSVPERHFGMVNILWCDGHVKAQTLAQMGATHDVAGTETQYLFTIEDD